MSFCTGKDIRALYKMKLRAEFADSLELHCDKQLDTYDIALTVAEEENQELRTDIAKKDTLLLDRKVEIGELNLEVDKQKGNTKKAGIGGVLLGIILTLILI